MNVLDIQIWQGLDCRADFKIVDLDRRAKNLLDVELVWVMKDRVAGTIMATYDVKILDDYKGLARLEIPYTDTLQFPLGTYSWAIMTRNNKPLEFQLGINIYGTVVVQDGPFPDIRPSITVTKEALMPRLEGFPLLVQFFTPPLPGAQTTGNIAGLHTVALYLDHFSGQLIGQATLEGLPPTTDESWVQIPIGDQGQYQRSYDNFVGIDSFTFNGQYRWVRFIVLPDQAYQNNPYMQAEGFHLKHVRQLLFRS